MSYSIYSATYSEADALSPQHIRWTNNAATAFSEGTGSTSVLVEGGKFVGRHTGYASRSDGIVGTARYGSGFPNAPEGSGNGLDVAERSFPFGFWPFYWGQDGYGGSSEYSNSTDRPGGLQTIAVVSKTRSEGEMDDWLFILGDQASVERVHYFLGKSSTGGGCGALTFGYPIYYFNPDDNSGMFTASNGAAQLNLHKNITIKPENVMQWYRGSSFALASLSYHNEASKNNNTSPETTQNTALPTAIEAEFLTCVNNTITKSIPILDSLRLKGGYEQISSGQSTRHGNKMKMIISFTAGFLLFGSGLYLS